jgi:GGDEF domain-containing protein
LIAERIRNEIIRPINIGAIEVSVDISIGIAMATEHSKQAMDVLKIADEAMYKNKIGKLN